MSSDFEKKDFFLFCFLPMMYDSDGPTVIEYLEEDFGPVTPDNIDDAIIYVRRRFERDLWQDNVGKQLLQQLDDDDALEGE